MKWEENVGVRMMLLAIFGAIMGVADFELSHRVWYVAWFAIGWLVAWQSGRKKSDHDRQM